MSLYFPIKISIIILIFQLFGNIKLNSLKFQSIKTLRKNCITYSTNSKTNINIVESAQAAAIIAIETSNLFNSDAETDDEVKKEVKKIKSKKSAPLLSAREATGYNFRDEFGEYDVPIINEPKWLYLFLNINIIIININY